jgi:RHS repeat-associated protein
LFVSSNHLGNVLVTVSDKKIGHDAGNGTIDYYTADVITANDYAPFGSLLPGRKYSQANTTYRYGFNGKENDKDINSGAIAFEARVYDSRIGRFLSRDPKESEYAWQSTYVYFKNSPISIIDIKGKGGGDPNPPKTYDKAKWAKVLETWSTQFHSMESGADHKKLVSATFQLIGKIDAFRDLGRTLSLHNLVRYAEGKGGYDVFSYSQLNTASNFGSFASHNREVRKDILTQLSSYTSTVLKKPGTYEVSFTATNMVSQGAAMTFDLGTAFGSYEILGKGKFSITVDKKGNYTYSGNLYYTFADNYRWHKGRGNGEEGVNHDKMIELEKLGAQSFAGRAYYEQSISGNQSSTINFNSGSDYKDSFDSQNHIEPTGYYSMPSSSNLINDFRKK